MSFFFRFLKILSIIFMVFHTQLSFADDRRWYQKIWQSCFGSCFEAPQEAEPTQEPHQDLTVANSLPTLSPPPTSSPISAADDTELATSPNPAQCEIDAPLSSGESSACSPVVEEEPATTSGGSDADTAPSPSGEESDEEIFRCFGTHHEVKPPKGSPTSLRCIRPCSCPKEPRQQQDSPVDRTTNQAHLFQHRPLPSFARPSRLTPNANLLNQWGAFHGGGISGGAFPSFTRTNLVSHRTHSICTNCRRPFSQRCSSQTVNPQICQNCILIESAHPTISLNAYRSTDSKIPSLSRLTRDRCIPIAPTSLSPSSPTSYQASPTASRWTALNKHIVGKKINDIEQTLDKLKQQLIEASSAPSAAAAADERSQALDMIRDRITEAENELDSIKASEGSGERLSPLQVQVQSIVSDLEAHLPQSSSRDKPGI